MWPNFPENDSLTSNCCSQSSLWPCPDDHHGIFKGELTLCCSLHQPGLKVCLFGRLIMWHVACDMWHVRGYTWDVTCDLRYVTCGRSFVIYGSAIGVMIQLCPSFMPLCQVPLTTVGRNTINKRGSEKDPWLVSVFFLRKFQYLLIWPA